MSRDTIGDRFSDVESPMHRATRQHTAVISPPLNKPQGNAAFFFFDEANPAVKNEAPIMAKDRGEVSASGSLENRQISEQISIRQVAVASPTAQPKAQATGTPTVSAVLEDGALSFFFLLRFLFDGFPFIKISSKVFSNLIICGRNVG